MLWRKSLSVWRNAFAEASTSEKPGAVIPHKRSNPCGTPGFVRGLSGNWQSYRNLINSPSRPSFLRGEKELEHS